MSIGPVVVEKSCHKLNMNNKEKRSIKSYLNLSQCLRHGSSFFCTQSEFKVLNIVLLVYLMLKEPFSKFNLATFSPVLNRFHTGLVPMPIGHSVPQYESTSVWQSSRWEGKYCVMDHWACLILKNKTKKATLPEQFILQDCTCLTASKMVTFDSTKKWGHVIINQRSS